MKNSPHPIANARIHYPKWLLPVPYTKFIDSAEFKNIEQVIYEKIKGLDHPSYEIGSNVFTSKFMENIILAGGAIASLVLGEDPRDWDLYFIKRIENVFYFDDFNVDFIGWKNGPPKEIIKGFDFLHSRCYWTLETGLVIPEDVYNCIVFKKLVIVNLNKPLQSIKRALKFSGKGWTINTTELKKLLEEVQKIDLDKATADDAYDDLAEPRRKWYEILFLYLFKKKSNS